MTKSEGVKTKQFCCLSKENVSENGDDKDGNLEEDDAALKHSTKQERLIEIQPCV